LLSPPSVRGQLEDYKRADAASTLFGNKMYNGNVRPVWIEESSIFWYENQTPDGRKYIVIDPVKKDQKGGI
jgi:hypothetical protein